MHDYFVRRESEYNRGTGCGKTARPGLCGGPLVTEAPTVRASRRTMTPADWIALVAALAAFGSFLAALGVYCSQKRMSQAAKLRDFIKCGGAMSSGRFGPQSLVSWMSGRKMKRE